jgi:hypothetical protein
VLHHGTDITHERLGILLRAATGSNPAASILSEFPGFSSVKWRPCACTEEGRPARASEPREQ